MGRAARVATLGAFLLNLNGPAVAAILPVLAPPASIAAPIPRLASRLQRPPDAFHRVKTESDALGRVIAGLAYSIAPDGAQSTTVTDALGRVTRDAYDSQGRWTTRTDPAGTTTVLSWDPNLQLAAVTEPDGRTTSFTYDARGNELTQTAPGGLTTRRTLGWCQCCGTCGSCERPSCVEVVSVVE